MSNGLALYAGSFDPLTNGHLYVIKEASKVFNQVLVVVGVNPNKPNSYFSVEERFEMIRLATTDLYNVRVTVNPSKYLIDFAREAGASFLVRGMRSQEDFASEIALCHYNFVENLEITTWFIIPSPNLINVSSSFVKGLVGYEGWQRQVAKYVPYSVYVRIVLKNDTLVVKLRDRWLGLCERISGNEGFDQYLMAFIAICNGYLEEHRFYHTLTHVNDCLEGLDQYRHLAKEPDVVELAIWMHDLVYNINETTNESLSAQEAFSICLGLGFPKEIAEKVSTYIKSTTHKDDPIDPDARLMLDIDLLSLSEPWPVFAADSANIRKEYAHVPDDVFNRERKRILRTFLERPRIYYTDEIRATHGADARGNLTASMFQLTEGR